MIDTNLWLFYKSLFKTDIKHIAEELNTSVIAWYPSRMAEEVFLANGIKFNIEYRSTPSWGFIFIGFWGLAYNYSRMDSRAAMFKAMRDSLKEQHANNGQESGF